ncbi:MAG: hypothetical protein JWN03_4751 [Nocardia sp.]|nr:hypothetical protein [Nocardia sp.]
MMPRIRTYYLIGAVTAGMLSFGISSATAAVPLEEPTAATNGASVASATEYGLLDPFASSGASGSSSGSSILRQTLVTGSATR